MQMLNHHGPRHTPRGLLKRAVRKVRLMVLLGILAPLLLPTAFGGLRADTALIAAEGYIYGFPILLMDETRDGFVGGHRDCENGEDINTFHHVYDIPTPDFRAVVRPNVDTLYSSAMLDLRQSPMLLDMPAVSDRYVLMALLDAWSNNFAGLGTQSHGADEGHYFITGPNWTGKTPRGYQRVESPTEFVWIIGRTEILDGEPLQVVNDIQDQYALTPYQSRGERKQRVECKQRQQPAEVILSLSPQAFFTRLHNLLMKFPTTELDDDMMDTLAKIHVGPKAEESITSLGYFEMEGLDDGIRNAKASLDLVVAGLGIGRQWGPDPKLIPLGDYEDGYFIRAVVAQVGFGANKGEYAVYQNLSRDSAFRLLDGDSVYSMTFAPGEEPPVNAFWSITVYDTVGFLTKNDAAEALGMTRYAVGTNTGLEYDEDGSLTIYMAAEPPVGVALSNWLPVPEEGNFVITLRMYDPTEAILESEWSAPMVVRQ